MPIYEYRCEECGQRSSALLGSYSSPDPVCPHCGKPRLRRLVSTFATVSSGGSELGGDDEGGHGHDEFDAEADEPDGGEDDFGDDLGDDY